jgi:CarD family transcriptional regulator
MPISNPSRASARRGPRTSAKDFAGFRRSNWSTATCRADGDPDHCPERKEATIPELAEAEAVDEAILEEVELEVENIDFAEGDKVVYPHHGAATIESREKKELFGEKREYFILKLAYGELTLMVPIDATEEVGLRQVTPAKEVPKVLKVLKKNEPTTNTTNWSRRFKANVEKLRSGDIYQVADVVRSLHQRDKEKGLAAGEKRMLTKARQILVSELTFSKNCKEEEAEQLLDEVLG